MHHRSENRPHPRTAPIPERLFRYLLDLEIGKATRLRYCVSLVCLTADREADQPDPWLARHIARVALRHLRGTDLATTLSQKTVALLLLDAELGTLSSLVQRVTAEVTSEGRRLSRRGRLVSVSGGASCYPITTASGAGLLRQASDLMRRAQQEGSGPLVLPPLPASTVG